LNRRCPFEEVGQAIFEVNKAPTNRVRRKSS